MGCCESLSGWSDIRESYSWQTYFLVTPLSPLIEHDELLVFLPFHGIVKLLTGQERQRDLQSSDLCSIWCFSGKTGFKGGTYSEFTS